MTPLLLSALLATTPVHAEPPAVTVSLAAGYFWPGPQENLASTWVFVPRVGLWITPHWGAEVDLAFAKGVTRTYGYPYWAQTPRLNVLYNILPERRIQPFIAAGPGIIRKSVERPPEVEADIAKADGLGNYVNPDWDFLANVGPGVFLEVNDLFLLRGDFRYMLNLGREPHGSRADVFSDWELTVGATLRFGGGEKAPPIIDTDGDGSYDDVDGCIHDPEDVDTWQDDDGCPDPDNDSDGIEDVDDACPDEPEDIDGFQDDDGCPDLDDDGDGFNEPDDDECPDEPGDYRGCPDRDQDGYLDAIDVCPDEWGPADGDGCPQKVQVTAEAIVILEKVYFDVNKATIKPVSFAVLDEVAQVMLSVDRIRMIEIAGHTDADGAEDANMDLSQARAEAVMTYLMDKGVQKARMTPVGYGEGKPIDSNNTSSGKAKNRRVAFTITDQDGDSGVGTE